MDESVERVDVEGHAHFLVLCAWCDRVLLDGAWRRASTDVIGRASADGALTHGICPACFAHQAPHDAQYPS